MPQPPTPNMGLIRPTDHGDGDVWDVLLDAMFLAIDAHSHAPGAGAKIQLSTINPDADFPMFDVAGNKRAFTGLKAVAFASVPPPVGLNGSLFIADGTSGTVVNELYFRNNVGTNIQFTADGIMNINGFTGGIGGDYNSVGALEQFNDGLDAYLFQQQVGAAVRQFAKMQCSEISLFEFKAVGITPVPNNSITLKVPVALANTFALTLPSALPATGRSPLQIDSSGIITVGLSSLSPAPLSSGNNNDYNPVGLATASFIRLDGTGATSPVITGIAGGVDGRVITLYNISSVGIQLSNENASSIASNRIINTSNISLSIGLDTSFQYVYDGASSRWRMIIKNI